MLIREIAHPRSTLEDFKAFLIKQNVFALAIAVVVGAALNAVVQGIVDDFIMPIVAVAVPDGAWREWVTPGPIAFRVGHFLSVLLNFLIVGFVAWRLTKVLLEPAPGAEAPTTRNCQYCRMAIDAAATRCAHCTSQL